MSKSPPAKPILTEIYARYLADENTAAFIGAVSQRYMMGTLERLAEYGGVVSRRAATLALSLVGTYESNDVLGRALQDRDRCVRVIAENGLRDLWMRDGSEDQQSRLRTIVRLNASQQYSQAIDAADDLIGEAPWFAEAWNQRAIAALPARSLRRLGQRLPSGPGTQPVSLRRGRGHGELLSGAQRRLRRAGMLPPRAPPQSRYGRNPRASGTAGADAGREVRNDSPALALQSGGSCRQARVDDLGIEIACCSTRWPPSSAVNVIRRVCETGRRVAAHHDSKESGRRFLPSDWRS